MLVIEMLRDFVSRNPQLFSALVNLDKVGFVGPEPVPQVHTAPHVVWLPIGADVWHLQRNADGAVRHVESGGWFHYGVIVALAEVLQSLLVLH